MLQSITFRRAPFISSTVRQLDRVAMHKKIQRRMSRTDSVVIGNTILRVTILLLVLFGAICAANAQSTFGTILGTVTDVTGAVITEAVISAQSLDDNVERRTTSTVSGEFILENVKAGRYKLTVHHDGFKDAVARSVALDARQELRIPFVLPVVTATTAIEVSAGAAQVNTENATIGDTVLNQDITELPMNSRAVSSSPLASLAVSPSVVSDSQGNISIGGATAAQTGFSVDGISTANVRANGALHDAYPSSEGISETKVTAFNNNAEFAQIGDVTFTTKSGTETWHGSAYEYFQNDALDSTIYGFTTKAPKNFNTFGGSLGGPVIIPGLWNGRSRRTYFFADYEGNRKTTSAPMLLLVPTQAERQGNLTDLVNIPGSPGVLTDPFTGNPYPNNTIPGGPGNSCANSTDCINPVAMTLLNNYYPQPNANLGAVNPAYNYQTLMPIPSNSNGWMFESTNP